MKYYTGKRSKVAAMIVIQRKSNIFPESQRGVEDRQINREVEQGTGHHYRKKHEILKFKRDWKLEEELIDHHSE